MNKFHSSVSRRDFMKGLGIAGAGLGAAAATVPVFHDLDEAVSAPVAGGFRRPWWVKEREYEDPTCEVDWSQIERSDNSWIMHGVRNGVKGGYLFAGQKYLDWQKEGSDRAFNGVKNNEPGLTLRDMALEGGASPLLMGLNKVVNFVLPEIDQDQVLAQFGFTAAAWPNASSFWVASAPPDFWGVPKWQGTPEENSRMLRSAMRFFGASEVRFAELNEKTKKLIFTHHVHNTPIVFEDVDKAYEVAGQKFVLPDKPLYIVSVAVQMSKEMYRQGNAGIRFAANNMRYRLNNVVQVATQSFLKGIGYQGIGYPSESLFHGMMPSQADAILTGFAEMARNNNYCISPEFGTVAGYYSILTDLPLAPDKPIDAGYFRFCHTCRKCAEACPSQAISFDSEPTWDIPPSSVDPAKATLYSTPGKKVFHTDSPACYSRWIGLHGCARCMGTCVFNTNSSAMVHDMVRATIGTTGLFNGFLWNADKAFGYGLIPPEKWEEWWDKDYPVLGQDSTIGSYYGGY
ncbi:reductive dehalogenase [Dehalococcoides mccartyi]|uniref:Reductive dehalogenase n=1 Tax=Dehalococcoides mccartyi (strain CBDB1) TaxID=255470 RepID=A0A916KLM9_DEHMC|nr:reductive dehalogenase [Dehalococcoides mccartyi]AGG05866.1 reductive dehalogenase [Dehalococcoides mccartyi DCMB5]OBW62901.1 MAG: reductive dehalogenase [Dehalococcoides mccartyi]BEL00337.1 reductive dehalogenase [Dehalococcoides mccartyi]CAI82474.1 putative reductive dehalogenase [Dehalococcoides mccartyi CBDB1]